MQSRSIVLKLVLDTLGIDSDIRTVDDRKRVQKAIYLGQLSGVDLGYRFSWYLMGPYSSTLTKDYFALSEDLEKGGDEVSARVLKDDIAEKFKKIATILPVPNGVELTQENWLELLASYHYLRTVSKKPLESTVETLEAKKPHVAKYVNQAQHCLEENGLINHGSI